MRSRATLKLELAEYHEPSKKAHKTEQRRSTTSQLYFLFHPLDLIISNTISASVEAQESFLGIKKKKRRRRKRRNEFSFSRDQHSVDPKAKGKIR
jgi:hypothetical protein